MPTLPPSYGQRAGRLFFSGHSIGVADLRLTFAKEDFVAERLRRELNSLYPHFLGIGCVGRRREEAEMLYWALVFLVIAVIAAALGFGGIAGASAGIAQIIFFVFLAFLVISVIAYFLRRA